MRADAVGRLGPFDEFNRELLAHVRPEDWVNPEPKGRYHLVVVGAGTGGLVTAAIAAGLGARVALVERSLMGGDCLNVGCVPSKALIAAARSWHAARTSADAFGGPASTGAGRFAAAMERMRRLRAGISPVDGAPRFRELGVDVYFGEGRFTSRETLTVDGRALPFRRAVVATGSRPATSSIPGLAATGYHTNESIFTLSELPARLLVLGAGRVGCEMAQAFARFGSRVTLVEQADQVLPREDADAARLVERAMGSHGVRILLRCNVLRAEVRDRTCVLHVQREGRVEAVEGEELLVAVGRRPTVEGLDLEAAGVSYDARGIAVDDRLRTTNPRVFAVGDVASRYRFTHAADAQARLVVANALFFGLGGGKASRLVIPGTTYTSPEIAQVGLTGPEAEATGTRIDTITVPLHEVDRAVLDGDDQGFFRVHLRQGTDRIVGATLVTERAGDMIGEVVLAMTAGIGLGKIGATVHPYPTQSEVFRKAADAWRRGRLTPRARAAFRTFFRLLG
jgi:pyruvate/2-oxoglutarate dehydrogenase complex dihydrolipoamide dehydrogenase (E3) component